MGWSQESAEDLNSTPRCGGAHSCDPGTGALCPEAQHNLSSRLKERLCLETKWMAFLRNETHTFAPNTHTQSDWTRRKKGKRKSNYEQTSPQGPQVWTLVLPGREPPLIRSVFRTRVPGCSRQGGSQPGMKAAGAVLCYGLMLEESASW